MDFVEFTAGEDESQRRFDRVAKRILEKNGSSDENVFRLLRKNLIRLNGKKSGGETLLVPGDVIGVASFLVSGHGESRDSASGNGVSGLSEMCEVLFRNSEILILGKKAGVSVQPSANSRACLSDAVLAEWKSSGKDSLSFVPGPLHRIDRFTSGAVCFSQSTAGSRWFSENMAEHRIRKTYLAVAQGEFGIIGKQEVFSDWISNEDSDSKGFRTVSVSGTESAAAKRAVTLVTPLAFLVHDGKKVTLCSVCIETGRKHQIRAQMAFHGFPLAGDTAYGAERTRCGHFWLHAWKLEFPENTLGIPAYVTCPLPVGFPGEDLKCIS